MPAIPEMSAVWSAWADAITLFCSQKLTPEEALKNAVLRIKETLKCK